MIQIGKSWLWIPTSMYSAYRNSPEHSPRRTTGRTAQWSVPLCFLALFIRLRKLINTHLYDYQVSIQNYRGHMPLKSYLFVSAWDDRATWCRNPSQILNPMASQRIWCTQFQEHSACHTSYTALIGVLGLEGMPPNLLTRTLKQGNETAYSTASTNGAAISQPSICCRQ